MKCEYCREKEATENVEMALRYVDKDAIGNCKSLLLHLCAGCVEMIMSRTELVMTTWGRKALAECAWCHRGVESLVQFSSAGPVICDKCYRMALEQSK